MRRAGLITVPAGAALLLLAARFPSVPAEDGREIYQGKGNCAACHGESGTGTAMAPDLTDAGWLHGDGSLDAIKKVVREGVAEPVEFRTPMPPMGGAQLTEDEIASVAGYVFSLSH